MSNVSNNGRAVSAEAVLEAFLALVDLDKGKADAISDIIADLGHYCGANGVDFVAAMQRGIGHWRVEVCDPNRIDIMPQVTIGIEKVLP